MDALPNESKVLLPPTGDPLVPGCIEVYNIDERGVTMSSTLADTQLPSGEDGGDDIQTVEDAFANAQKRRRMSISCRSTKDGETRVVTKAESEKQGDGCSSDDDALMTSVWGGESDIPTGGAFDSDDDSEGGSESKAGGKSKKKKKRGKKEKDVEEAAAKVANLLTTIPEEREGHHFFFCSEPSKDEWSE